MDICWLDSQTWQSKVVAAKLVDPDKTATPSLSNLMRSAPTMTDASASEANDV